MKTLTVPTTNAADAVRYLRTVEAAKNADLTIWPGLGGIVTIDSWKTVNGKRTFDRYEVDTNAPACTCPDFQKRGHYCKHLLRVMQAADAEVQSEAAACEMDAATYAKWEAANVEL